MDWVSVVRVLAQSGSPTAVLDAGLRVRLVNDGLEHLLGRSREDLEGQRLDATCLATAADGCTCRVPTGDGRHLELEIDTVRFGVGRDAVMLLRVRKSHERRTGASQDDVLEYDVGGTITEFGTLARVRTGDGVRRYWGRDAPRCHQEVYGQGAPCADCPVFRLERRGTSSATFSRTLAAGGAPQMATVERMGAAIRVRVRRMPRLVVTATFDLMLEDLVVDAALSHRERDVLTHLLAGRTVAAIADLMSLDARTVRAHQASVLKKLGGAPAPSERYRFR